MFKSTYKQMVSTKSKVEGRRRERYYGFLADKRSGKGERAKQKREMDTINAINYFQWFYSVTESFKPLPDQSPGKVFFQCRSSLVGETFPSIRPQLSILPRGDPSSSSSSLDPLPPLWYLNRMPDCALSIEDREDKLDLGRSRFNDTDSPIGRKTGLDHRLPTSFDFSISSIHSARKERG